MSTLMQTEIQDLIAQSSSTGVGGNLAQYWNRIEVDPVSLQIIGGASNAIATEMAELLFRMAYSSIMRESRDIGAGILDTYGRQLCESDSTPMHCGSLPAYVKGVNRKLAGNYQPGDVILHNHPYHGASHSPDFGVLIPIFYQGQHLGFAGCTGHMVDIGAANPGFSVDVPDVWAEGLLIDSAKIYAEGVRNEFLWDHLMSNVRTPEANAGDLEAMISCCRLGVRRYLELLDKYGLDKVMSANEEWMDYSERMMRQRIEAVPDGIYNAPDGWLEDDGKNFGIPLKICTRVIVLGSDIYIDLSGSSDEVETGFNCPFAGSVLPTANFAIRTLLLDEALIEQKVPQNDGIFRPIHVFAPKGSIYNPNFPRGCEARFVQINRLPDQVLQAFSEAMPDSVTAGNSANVSCMAYSGTNTAESKDAGDEDSYWVNIEINEGSYGGRFGKDGIDAIDNLMANTRNNPVEEMELSAPMICERYELRDESPAPGKWRGGIGAVKCWRFLEPVIVSSTGDNREKDPPRGLFGGSNGRPGKIIHSPNTGEARLMPAKMTDMRLAAGDRLEITLVSAAGYGNPKERDPEQVLSDVRDEYLTIEEALVNYAVAINADTQQLDHSRTASLRAIPASDNAP
jgi:N-methylhydantoinase B